MKRLSLVLVALLCLAGCASSLTKSLDLASRAVVDTVAIERSVCNPTANPAAPMPSCTVPAMTAPHLEFNRKMILVAQNLDKAAAALQVYKSGDAIPTSVPQALAEAAAASDSLKALGVPESVLKSYNQIIKYIAAIIAALGKS